MKPIVVAGGAGFIGSHLVDALLEKGKDVIVIDDLSTGNIRNLDEAKSKYPEKITVHELDICTPEAKQVILDSKPEVVHLLSAQWSVKVSMRDPLFDARVNVVGLVNMLEAAREAGVCKVTFSSSGGTIYGNHPESELPLTEETPRRPESFYGLTKSVMVDYLNLYKKSFGLKSVALALGNVYGPRQSPFGEAGVVGIFGQRLLSGKRCTVNGDGLTTRDYIHVSDVVKAFVAAGEQGEGLYNIGTGIETSVLDVFRVLSGILDLDTKPTHGDPLPGEVRRVLLSVAKAEKELGWKAEVGFEDGARTVVDWLKETYAGQAK